VSHHLTTETGKGGGGGGRRGKKKTGGDEEEEQSEEMPVGAQRQHGQRHGKSRHSSKGGKNHGKRENPDKTRKKDSQITKKKMGSYLKNKSLSNKYPQRGGVNWKTAQVKEKKKWGVRPKNSKPLPRRTQIGFRRQESRTNKPFKKLRTRGTRETRERRPKKNAWYSRASKNHHRTPSRTSRTHPTFLRQARKLKKGHHIK